MQDIMKLTIVLKALVGGVQSLTGRTKEADFFVVNDSSAKQPEFKVYSMEKIISNAEKKE